MFGAGDVDESYCRACMKQRKSTIRCGGCTKPILYPQNEQAFHLFAACYSQFIKDDYGIPHISYSDVKTTAEMMGVVMTPDQFQKFRTMEREFILISSEAKESGG